MIIIVIYFLSSVVSEIDVKMVTALYSHYYITLKKKNELVNERERECSINYQTKTSSCNKAEFCWIKVLYWHWVDKNTFD